MPEAPWPDLPPGLTLRLWEGGTSRFASGGRWLHPLFEVEAFLASRPGLDPAALRLEDRVTGRAAALLVARLGIRTLDTGVLSRRAVDVLETHGVAVRAGALVDRLACATEALLAEETDLDRAYDLLAARRGRALEVMP